MFASTSMSQLWISEGSRRGCICQWTYRRSLKAPCRSLSQRTSRRHHRTLEGPRQSFRELALSAVAFLEAVKMPLPNAGIRAKAGRDTHTAKSTRTRETLLTLENVGRTHDGHTQLFSNVSATLTRGERLAVVGPNGCGKTTLLRLIAGEEPVHPPSALYQCELSVQVLWQCPGAPTSYVIYLCRKRA